VPFSKLDEIGPRYIGGILETGRLMCVITPAGFEGFF
jgi:hypothetical protein